MGSTFEKNSNNAYKYTAEKKNLLMLPSGVARKRYVTETTCVIKLWIYDITLKLKSLKAFNVMPTLLFQKQWKPSKAKDHLKDALSCGTKVISKIYLGPSDYSRKVKTEQRNKECTTIAKISLKFKNLY